VLARDAGFINGEAGRAFKGVVKKKRKGSIELDRRALMDLGEALKVRVFVKAAAYLKGEGGIYGPHIDSFLSVLKGRRPNASLDLPGLHLRREYESVIVTSVESAGAARPIPFDMELTVPGVTRIREAGCRLKAAILKKKPRLKAEDKNTAYFDYDALTAPLRVRVFCPGDRMRPFGMKGRRKLKDIFMDLRVPRAKRPLIPLVTSGGGIIWAAGLRRADLAMVTGRTKRVLRITFSQTG
jgi:tRNA(Ile)-lysidine synthase